MPRAWSYVDLILVILGGLIGTLIGAGIASTLGDDELLIVLGWIGQYAGHLAAIWLLFRRKQKPDLGFSIEGRDVLYIGAGVFLQIFLVLAFLPLTRLLLPEGDSAQEVGITMAELDSPAVRLGAMLAAVVLAPLTEELMFRGVLLKAVKSGKNWVLMSVTAIVFVAFHINGLDRSRFFEAAAIIVPQLFIVGLVLAWVTLRSKRLGPAIFIHSGFNLLAVAVLLLPSEVLDRLS